MSKVLTSIVGAAARAPVTCLLLIALATVGAGLYAFTQFRVNADQTSLIAPNAPFQVRFDEFRDAFPTYKRTTLVLVESDSRSLATRSAKELANALAKRDDLFLDIFAPADLPFYRENGLLFLSMDELQSQLDAIAQAQPALATAANQKGLEGLLTLLRSAGRDDLSGAEPPAELAALARHLEETAQAAANGQPLPPLAISPGGSRTAIQLVTIRIREDNTDFLSPRAKLDVIRDTARELGLTPENGVTIRLTGNIPLSVDELRQVRDSIGLAGVLSLIMLALVLGLGVRSGRIVSVMVLTLAIGGVWSMGWAMFSVGELNLLSATFAILFVGLGIDFAIHFALRVQEDVEAYQPVRAALVCAAREVGPAISLGALTSAIGFLAFLPTEYKGFADLGVIAGGGMILALIAALTVIPAVFSLSGVPGHRRAGDRFANGTQAVFKVVRRHAGVISLAAILLGIAAVAVASRSEFDFSTLSLKNDSSESIQALAALQERGLVTDYAAYIVTPSPAAAEEAASKLATLETVGRVMTVSSLVPDDQDEKLARIGETADLVYPVFGAADRPAAPLPASLDVPPGSVDDPAIRTAYADLETTLKSLTPGQLEQLNEHVAGELSRELGALEEALGAQRVTLADIPMQVQERFLSPDGQALAIGLPAGDITDTADLRPFVDEVKAAFPDSTGRAVVEATVGDVVVESFVFALLLAAAGVTLVVLIATRSPIDTALVMFPLLLAASATAAIGVIIDMPFNQANIIVLPLIMGLGVDNGLHVLMRFRHDRSMERMMASSTPRAVVLSTLTTIGAFGALGTSLHDGMASMGILLTIAMANLLVATVVILPALLTLRARAERAPA